jgi:hypothetical protein
MSHELSRRTVLRSSAAAGVGGLAAGALGAIAVEAGTASATSAGGAGAAATGPIVVHVRDARTGELDIFTGTGVLHVRDTGITSRINTALA